jgi:hypothetical protein
MKKLYFFGSAALVIISTLAMFNVNDRLQAHYNAKYDAQIKLAMSAPLGGLE